MWSLLQIDNWFEVVETSANYELPLVEIKIKKIEANKDNRIGTVKENVTEKT